MVPSIARVLKPGSLKIEKGDAYHFFKNFFTLSTSDKET